METHLRLSSGRYTHTYLGANPIYKSVPHTTLDIIIITVPHPHSSSLVQKQNSSQFFPSNYNGHFLLYVHLTSDFMIVLFKNFIQCDSKIFKM